MQAVKRWTPWILCCLLGLVAVRAVAQSSSSPAQAPRTSGAGRYAVYYRSADYSQILLLDTSTGAIWELTTSKYKSIAEGHQGEEVAFHTFERLGVEGLYQSIADKILNQQLNQQFLNQLKEEPSHP